MLAVELFKVPQICLGVVHVVVFARVHEHRVVTHLATLLTCAFVVLPAFALACRAVTCSQVISAILLSRTASCTASRTACLSCANLVSLQESFHHPMTYFP